jgi:hypothetical protein
VKIVTDTYATEFPGYEAVNVTVDRYRVFCNGQRVPYAIAVDTDAGVVVKLETDAVGQLVVRGGEIRREQVCGYVMREKMRPEEPNVR